MSGGEPDWAKFCTSYVRSTANLITIIVDYFVDRDQVILPSCQVSRYQRQYRFFKQTEHVAGFS